MSRTLFHDIKSRYEPLSYNLIKIISHSSVDDLLLLIVSAFLFLLLTREWIHLNFLILLYKTKIYTKWSYLSFDSSFDILISKKHWFMTVNKRYHFLQTVPLWLTRFLPSEEHSFILVFSYRDRAAALWPIDIFSRD